MLGASAPVVSTIVIRFWTHWPPRKLFSPWCSGVERLGVRDPQLAGPGARVGVEEQRPEARLRQPGVEGVERGARLGRDRQQVAVGELVQAGELGERAHVDDVVDVRPRRRQAHRRRVVARDVRDDPRRARVMHDRSRVLGRDRDRLHQGKARPIDHVDAVDAGARHVGAVAGGREGDPVGLGADAQRLLDRARREVEQGHARGHLVDQPELPRPRPLGHGDQARTGGDLGQELHRERVENGQALPALVDRVELAPVLREDQRRDQVRVPVDRAVLDVVAQGLPGRGAGGEEGEADEERGAGRG